MTTTFYLPNMSAPEASHRFGAWRCRVERVSPTSCNVVFFDEDEWKRFEQYADENNIEYSLV